jgi:hypothetical protein
LLFVFKRHDREGSNDLGGEIGDSGEGDGEGGGEERSGGGGGGGGQGGYDGG